MILFGSQARGQANVKSDIDIALLADAPMTSAFKRELVERVAACFGRAVDLYHPGEPILGEVLKGKVLMGDRNLYAKLITQHVMNVADFLPLRNRILKERRKAWLQSS